MPKKVAKKNAEESVVLVGTYSAAQMKKWILPKGYYNYPVGEEDDCTPAHCKRIKELWLYKGKSARKVFSAEFIGVKTRAELPDYPATKTKPHGEKYLLFKVAELYGPQLENATVHVRVSDFAKRSPKIAAAIKAFQEGSKAKPKSAKHLQALGAAGILAEVLPGEIAQVPPERLCIREAAVQFTFFTTLMKTEANATMMNRSNRPIAIDLFAGCGGLSLGFEQAGFDIAAAVEIDPIHAAAHEYNFPYAKTICADIKNINGADIRRLANIGDRDVDIVFGGAPCQGFSMIGKRALDDPRNQLIGHYLRIVNDIRPKYCVLENVKGLTVGKHAQFLAELIDELKKINYKVLLPYRVLNAANYGVPQNRERLFLIAAREDQNLPVYPLQNEERVTVQEAISDLPDADHYEQLLSDDAVQVRWQTRCGYARQLRGQTPDSTNFGYDREFDQNLLTASWRTIHGGVSQARFLAAPQGQTEPHSRFFKLAWGGQCNTLRAGTDSARGGFTSPRPIHPVLPRVITVREAARIHSYPDWFRFNKTKWHGFREIGNSVPPRLARAVGSSVIAALGIVPVKPTCVIKPGDESLLGFDMRAAADYFGVSRNVIAQRKRKNDGK